MKNRFSFVLVLALVAALFTLSLAGCSGQTAAASAPSSAAAETAETALSEESVSPASHHETTPKATATPAPTAAPEPTVVPDSITLETTEGILTAGNAWTIRASVLPEDAADKTLHWTSSDETVATVDENGTVTAHQPGMAVITVRSNAGNAQAEYNMYVQAVTCSYCGASGHTSTACPVQAQATAEAQAGTETQVAAEAQAAAEAQVVEEAQNAEETQTTAEVSTPAGTVNPETGELFVDQEDYYANRDAYPEGTVVTRPDGTHYVLGPRSLIYGYRGDMSPEDLNNPALYSDETGTCVVCGADDHDVWSCPIMDEVEGIEHTIDD